MADHMSILAFWCILQTEGLFVLMYFAFCIQALKRRMRTTLSGSLKRRWASKMLLLRSYSTFGMAMRRAACGGDYLGVPNSRRLHESAFELR